MQEFKDFIIINYSLLTRIIEAIPVLVGLLLFKKYKHTKVKYFIYYLIFVLIGEIIATYPEFLHYEFFEPLDNLVTGTVFKRNYWWYTIFWQIGSTVFLAFYFIKSIYSKWSKNLIKTSTLFFLLASCLYILFFWDSLLNSYSYFINITSLIVRILVILLFFIEILQKNGYSEFSKSIDFYIAWIFFIWWLIITPLEFFNDYYNALDEAYTNLQWYIRISANFFMYVGFAIALILCKPPRAVYLD